MSNWYIEWDKDVGTSLDDIIDRELKNIKAPHNYNRFFTSLKNDHDNTRNQISHLEKDILVANAERDNYREYFLSLQKCYDDITELYKKEHQLVIEKEFEILNTIKQVEEQKEITKKEKEKVDILFTEIEQLKKKLEEATNNNNKNNNNADPAYLSRIESDNSKLQIQNNKLKLEMNGFREQNNLLKNENSKLKNENAELKNENKKISDSYQQVLNANNNNKKLHEQQLMQNAQQRQNSENYIMELMKTNSNLQNQLASSDIHNRVNTLLAQNKKLSDENLNFTRGLKHLENLGLPGVFQQFIAQNIRQQQPSMINGNASQINKNGSTISFLPQNSNNSNNSNNSKTNSNQNYNHQ